MSAAQPIGAERPSPESGTAPRTPTAERRLVSVLFADVVGYTSVAEALDSEDARDLLDRYFATAREIVSRYGGIVEKFIGDAVMAVWGTPTAHEDDAERAVRAAMDLTAAVPALGAGTASDAPPLRIRAAVLTGEAAVNLAADGQGMVAGDLVNTASRLQSVAEPGTVLVGEATMRSASGAIAFEPMGEHHLKGKQAPVPAWRAVSVVGKVGGAGRSDLIEPPFVGREAEFSAVKERLHATSQDHRIRLVSITGVAGIGKSRLAWELEKYLDGLVETVYWHHGRSLAYGDGIAFWALGEMVRRRAGIAEHDDPESTAEKLAASVAEYASDPEEEHWILPRLRALLGLEETTGDRQEELFAAWRRFFERIAERSTTVLVFEDLQWADQGLVAFIDSLMEWSRGHPMLIVTLARPEIFERHPTWGAGQRDFTALHLDPLPAPAMTALVSGLAPGLPAAVVETIVLRAEGVPLYAVELFRMLVDRGRILRGAGGYELLGDGRLDVPETLQSLIAARLDALPPAERRLLQDAAVLGQTFTPGALAAVSGDTAASMEPMLRSLVRRELLSIDHDPRSPERGQYGFLGALVREVAYGTLARRDRRARHLAAARHFEALGDDELAGVLASHYLAAHAASQDGAEADAVATQARIALRSAADRAQALASSQAAVTYLQQALAVTTEPHDVAQLRLDIAQAAHRAASWAIAEQESRAAHEAFGALGDAAGVARASAALGNILFFQGRIEAAVEMLSAALQGIDPGETALDVQLRRQLGRAEMFRARPDRAMEWIESGLAAAARVDDLDAIGDLMVTRNWAISVLGRLREAIAGDRGAIEFARSNGLVDVELRATNNLSTFLLDADPGEARRLLDAALQLAERIGDREYMQKLSFVAMPRMLGGDWAGAQELVERLSEDMPNLDYLPIASCRAQMRAWSGDREAAMAEVRTMRNRLARSESTQDAFAVHLTEVGVAMAAADIAGALRSNMEFEAAADVLGLSWHPAAYRGILAARTGDLPGIRAGIERLAAIPTQFEPITASRRALEGMHLAREGRSREATIAFRDALERYRRTGNLMFALLVDLDIAEVMDPAEALSREASDEIHRFVEKTGAVVYERQLEQRLALANGRIKPDATASNERQPARAAENILTTS